MNFNEIKERLTKLDTACICDANKDIRALDAAIRPISCGGVTINPGDILFGDNDGIIAASNSEIVELIPLAEEIQQKEEMVLAKLKKGESLLDYLNFKEHFANVQANMESQLKFIIKLIV